MHILHALFTPGNGGLEASYLDTTEALSSKGHRITALLRPHAPYLPQVKQVAAEVFTAQPTGFYDIITAWKIHRILLRLRPDLIIAHNARAIALLSLAATGTGIRVCGVSHSYKTARAIRADALVVLTPHMREHFIKAGYPEEKLHIIPNLIRLPESLALKPRSTPIVIGALGRLTKEKGFNDLLKALSFLKQEGVNFTAHIGGQGEESSALHQLAESLGLSANVIWDGWVKDKHAFYQKLDVMCVPSLKESFGLVVLEALAHGVPVIATDAPGPANILTSDLNGLLVPRGDSQAMAKAIQKLAEKPELAAQLAESGWQRAQDFSFKKVATQWDDMLRLLVFPFPFRERVG